MNESIACDGSSGSDCSSSGEANEERVPADEAAVRACRLTATENRTMVSGKSLVASGIHDIGSQQKRTPSQRVI